MRNRISDIPNSDRPREKLQKKGATALSDLELLAVMLGSGTKKYDVMMLASCILKVIDQSGVRADINALKKIEGVGSAKAALIAASLEFARRRIRPEGTKISFPVAVLPLIRHFADRKQEHFICLSLNGANEIIKSRVVSVGLVDKTQVHPREVFADPITDRASSIIVAHNHPSRSLTPSKEDIKTTRQLKLAGKTLDINLLDHIIFNHKGYFSFQENGDL